MLWLQPRTSRLTPNLRLAHAFEPRIRDSCIGTTFWNLYILLVLFTVSDLYQLYNCILSFKCYAFFFWGVLPILSDYLAFYETMTRGHSIPDELCGSTGTGHHMSFVLHDVPYKSLLNAVEDRQFLLNWVLCWVVFARFYWLQSRYLDGTRKPPTLTGDNLELGKREQMAPLFWDVAATCTILLVACLDLTYRIFGAQSLWAYFEITFGAFFMQHDLLKKVPAPHPRHATAPPPAHAVLCVLARVSHSSTFTGMKLRAFTSCIPIGGSNPRLARSPRSLLRTPFGPHTGTASPPSPPG